MSIEVKSEGTANDLEISGRSAQPTIPSVDTEELFQRAESQFNEGIQFARQWAPPQRVEALLARPDSEAREILSKLSPETVEGYRQYLQEHIENPRDPQIRFVFSSNAPVDVQFPLVKSQAIEMKARLEELTGADSPQP
jgi:hypothetical protein